jgi:hypothetical protein
LVASGGKSGTAWRMASIQAKANDMACLSVTRHRSIKIATGRLNRFDNGAGRIEQACHPNQKR